MHHLTLLLGCLQGVLAPSAVQSPISSSGTVPAANSAATIRHLETRVKATHLRVRESVVAIFDAEPGAQEEAATATIVSADGYVLTAAHCLDEPGSIVQLRLASGRRVKAKTLGRERALDFGLMKIIDEGPFPHVEMKRGGADLVRDEVLLMYGFPDGGEKGRGAVVRMGTFLGVRDDGMIRSSCAMMPGDSGGPLFDLDGHLVGVNSEIDFPLDQNYHVQSAAALSAWDRLVAGDVWGEDPFADWYGGDEGDYFDDEVEGEDYEEEEFDLAEIRLEVLEEARVRASEQTDPAAPGEGFDASMLLLGGRPQLLSSLKATAAAASLATVRITSQRRDGAQSALGICVGGGPDSKESVGSLVISKSSCVGSDTIRCRLSNGTTDTAKVVYRDDATDLVLLRLGQSQVKAAPIPDGLSDHSDAPAAGSFIAATAPTAASGSVVGVGVVGSAVHATKRRAYGYLGVVVTGRPSEQPRIESVSPGGAADRAGLEAEDLIVGFGEAEIDERSEFRKELRESRPGQAIAVVVLRDGEEVELELILDARPDTAFEETGHVAYLTETSVRKGSFEGVFRHDTHVPHDQCGGPLVGLDGQVVGMNIARVDRTGSLALTPSTLNAFIRRGLSAQSE